MVRRIWVIGFLIMVLLVPTSCSRIIEKLKPREKSAPQETSTSVSEIIATPDNSLPTSIPILAETGEKLKLKLIKAPKEYGSYGGHYWGPDLLTDGQITSHAYSSASGVKMPMRFVFELAGGNVATVNTVGISNYCEGWKSSQAKSISISTSNDQDPNNEGAYAFLREVELTQTKNLQNFEVTPTQGRYLALDVKANFGGTWVIFNEIEVLGIQH